MEIFTKESWERYKQHILDYNNEATKDLPFGIICGHLKSPTFEGYMEFALGVEEEW